ncbi:hypothetical protein [Flavobacterium okayamense]|uniref:Uncharacterized protein n=1 Tax=Flavobacterium okayamense TaxID=2830782 RepID=A0ABN6HUI0_9FLAO|nr:hypothetical protein [Flavobacterium okayamense]BCY28144.1 hypothetical protein KK2020170_10120 [Flavobacterium okayamense]
MTQDEIKVFNTSSFENIMICTDVSNSSVFLNAGLVDETIIPNLAYQWNLDSQAITKAN